MTVLTETDKLSLPGRVHPWDDFKDKLWAHFGPSEIYLGSDSLGLYVPTSKGLSNWATVYGVGLKRPRWVHFWEV